MTTAAFDRYNNRRNFEIPIPPDEFGHDGGAFYRCYDELADEFDDNMVEGLKQQLDGLLLFAGLFAGVNSAFLALTLPLMSPDPADDTNALLRENNALLRQSILQINDSIPTQGLLPSESFSPTGKILTVNIMFSRTGGGPDRQRWEQLQRFLGAERWKLQGILDDILPSILQAGLIIFCTSLTVYLSTLHPTLSTVVGAIMCTGLAILIITAIFSLWDKFCPFQSPLSHFIKFLPTVLFSIANAVKIISNKITVAGVMGAICWVLLAPVVPIILVLGRDEVMEAIQSLLRALKRRPVKEGTLQVISIRRAICASDDPLTLTYSLSNLLSIGDGAMLRVLLGDDEFYQRLLTLLESSYSRALQFLGRDQSGLASSVTWMYRATLIHVTMHGLDRWRPEPFQRNQLWIGCDEPSSTITSFLSQAPHPKLINGCLCYITLYSASLRNNGQDEFTPAHYTELQRLFDPTWERIGIILLVVAHFDGIYSNIYPEESAYYGLQLSRLAHWSYTGEPEAVMESLKFMLLYLRSSNCKEPEPLITFLVETFTWTSKAAVDAEGRAKISVPDSVDLFILSRQLLLVAQCPREFAAIERIIGDIIVNIFDSQSSLPMSGVDYSQDKDELDIKPDVASAISGLIMLLLELCKVENTPTAAT
ncbi:hypothetical protein FRB90_006555, partial [Tulasnella sp. 427]